MGLDTVELVLAWEESFDISLSTSEALTMITTRRVVDMIYEKVRSALPEDRGSLSIRAFYRLRKGFEQEGVARRDVRLEAKVAALLPGRRPRETLSAVAQRAGLPPLRRIPFSLQLVFGRVRDLVLDAVIQQHHALRLEGHGWSREQVREVVRAVMLAQVDLRRFSDDAEIVRDLGVD